MDSSEDPHAKRRLTGIDRVVPNVDPDDVEAWLAERRALIAAVAAGTVDPDAYARSGRTLTGAPAVAANSPAAPNLRVIPGGPS
jgi:hypothetical protein